MLSELLSKTYYQLQQSRIVDGLLPCGIGLLEVKGVYTFAYWGSLGAECIGQCLAKSTHHSTKLP